MRLIDWIGISRSKHAKWQKRYGMALEHNGLIPRDHWLADWEKEQIKAFQRDNPLEGYRRLTYMMIDKDIVAVSPSSAYRVLQQAGLLQRKARALFNHCGRTNTGISISAI
jgi:putative transposase